MNDVDSPPPAQYPRRGLLSRLALIRSTALVIVFAAVAMAAGSSSARAAGLSCALTTNPSTPAAPTPGNPCWTDVTPYPFGSDGNPVVPGEPLCNVGSSPFGPTWGGDFAVVNGNPPCYMQVTSMAFRAWNRGLAATNAGNFGATSPFGVWLFNGTSWFPDPTFPGTASCPGSTVLWAGKLDYWLVGSSAAPVQTVCRFDGVNLVWEPLTLPQATLARFPIDPASLKPAGGITSGACYAWNNCWLFGDDGIREHWDGQTLSDASTGLATSPWLAGDFTDAVAGTDPSGNEFGLAVTSSGANGVQVTGGRPLPAQPGGSPPPQVFSSQGGSFSPMAFSPPATAQPGDPFTTDLLAVAADANGAVWVAGDPTVRIRQPQGAPAPLLPLTEGGAAEPCTGYGATTFTESAIAPATGSYQWRSLSVFPNDGSALAGASYGESGVTEPVYGGTILSEPALVRAACGQPPALTRFEMPDPFVANQNQAQAPMIPADNGGSTSAVAANASNDAWAATTYGDLFAGNSGGSSNSVPVRPHVYRWTDGQPPAAPAGDDNESRPSLFTIGPPLIVPSPPTTVVITPPGRRVTAHQPGKKIKRKPPIYDPTSRLQHGPGSAFTLYITFKVRAPVTIGVEGLRRGRVVASSGLRHFSGRSGRLALTLNTQAWPTSIKFILPKKKR